MAGRKWVDNESTEVLQLEVGPFGNNVYIVRDRIQSCCALIDASAEPDTILRAVGADRLVAVLLTHAHMDHVQALGSIRERTGAPLGMHPAEPGASGLQPEIQLEEGRSLAVGSLELGVLHTPGHTPGGLCFLLRPEICFCGDTVFPGGPGKTGSPEAFLQLIESIEKKLYTLPDRMRLLPGHGESILVGDSKKEYAVFCSRPRQKTPYGDVLWEES